MSKFMLPSSPTDSYSEPHRRASISSTDSTDLSSLPFPKPLSRAAFSQPGPFSPHDFLTTLHNRHQTLEDLRQELRSHSQEIENELVELVNRDYGDFVGLGISLQGGEGRVEDLRVGLLAFRRKIEGVKMEVKESLGEVDQVLKELEGVKREKEAVARLLAVDEKLGELESWLGIGETVGLDLWGEDGQLDRLKDIVSTWRYLISLVKRAPSDSPFIKNQQGRIKKVKAEILKDLESAYKDALREKKPELVDLLGLYDALEERKIPARISRQLKNA